MHTVEGWVPQLLYEAGRDASRGARKAALDFGVCGQGGAVVARRATIRGANIGAEMIPTHWKKGHVGR